MLSPSRDKAAGAGSFLHVTAMGASAGSRVFYNRVKGETERDVAAVGIATTVAFRPSIIDGDRAESRPGEQAGPCRDARPSGRCSAGSGPRAPRTWRRDGAPRQGGTGRHRGRVHARDHPLGGGLTTRQWVIVYSAAVADLADLGAPGGR